MWIRHADYKWVLHVHPTASGMRDTSSHLWVTLVHVQVATSQHIDADRLLRLVPQGALLVVRALLLERFGRHKEVLWCESCRCYLSQQLNQRDPGPHVFNAPLHQYLYH